MCLFFFSSRRRHTRLVSDWSSDVCSSDLKIDIERSANRARITIATARPGIIIGRKGSEVEKLKNELQEIGRASCRERVEMSGGDGALERKGRNDAGDIGSDDGRESAGGKC